MKKKSSKNFIRNLSIMRSEAARALMCCGSWVTGMQKTTGKVHRCFKGQATTSLKERPEGVRLRHTLNGNSLKLYDKEGRNLRVETTVLHPEQFKVYRPKEGNPTAKNRGENCVAE
jgi:hypothetical protein